MLASRAQFVYHWATIVAGFIVLATVINFIYKFSIGQPIVPFVPLLVAAAIWLVGRLCLLFAGR